MTTDTNTAPPSTVDRIRAVFRQCGLYNHAADDLLCERLAEAVKAQAQNTPELYERAARFYDGEPTGQYDELAAEALRRYAPQPQPQAEPVDIRAGVEAMIDEWDEWAAENQGTRECFEASFRAGLRAVRAAAPQPQPQAALYGYCPMCGSPGAMRERRPNGNDKCSNGHTYPSHSALPALAQPQGALLTNPYTGTPRDYRDVESDPAGVLIHEPGAPLRAASPQPQPQAEPVVTRGHCENHKQPGGCPLHNLHCGWPKCDEREEKANG